MGQKLFYKYIHIIYAFKQTFFIMYIVSYSSYGSTYANIYLLNPKQ